MAELIYIANTSLDGYIENESGEFDWTLPSPEVHAYITNLVRPAGTYLYGRHMYETMAVWQTIGLEHEASPVELDFLADEGRAFAEVWRAADKIVYSRTLDAVSTPRTRLEREFDPNAVRRLKDSAERDLAIGGPGIAQHAFAAGLVDDVHLFVYPVIVGGGKPGLPRGVRIDLELVDERRFSSGIVHLHHRRR